MRLRFTEGTFAQRDRLVKLRGLGDDAGVNACVRRGLLRFCEFQGAECWCVTDQTEQAKQMRRLDGNPLLGANGIEMKAKSTFGSVHSWPIGTIEAREYDYIAIVEGGPDLLAAHQYAYIEDKLDNVAICAMLGSSNKICDDALAELSGKRIRVIGHADKAGAKARTRWMEQLAHFGCKVDAYDLCGLTFENGKQVSDINDLFYCQEDSIHFLMENQLFDYVGE
jgi:hypothetical protein